MGLAVAESGRENLPVYLHESPQDSGLERKFRCPPMRSGYHYRGTAGFRLRDSCALRYSRQRRRTNPKVAAALFGEVHGLISSKH